MAFREFRGISYIDFPSEYCLVDIETTGLDLYSDEIIEIGAIKYSDRKIVCQFQTLVQPSCRDGNFGDGFITALIGITNEMLSDAPKPHIAIRNFADFLGDNVIVGYNVSFDVNFLYDAFIKHLKRPLKNNFIDILRISKRLCVDLPSRDLDSVMLHFDIASDNRHRAIGDCIAAELVYERLQEEALKNYSTLDEFSDTFKSYSVKTQRQITDKVLEDWKKQLYACNTVKKAFDMFKKSIFTMPVLRMLAEYLEVKVHKYAGKSEIITALVYSMIDVKLSISLEHEEECGVNDECM